MARLNGTTPCRDHRTSHLEDTDHSLLPGTDISRNAQTTTQGPSTPVRPFGLNRNPGNSFYQHPQDGPVSLTRHDVSQAPTSRTQWSPTNTLCFSTTNANIGLRRSQHGSMLLTSPARLGHASRMKQIFEEAGAGSKLSHHDGLALYPQLPNISRLSSPPTRYRKSPTAPQITDPGSFLPPKEPLPVATAMGNPNATSSPLSGSSSGTWSDDSGYIILDHARPLARSGSPRHRIEDWLSTVSHENKEAKEGAFKAKPRHADVPPALFQQANLQPATVVNEIRTSSIPNRQPVEQKFPHDRNASLHDPFVNRHSSGESSTDRTSTIAEVFHCPSPYMRSQRHVSDTCGRLHFDLPGVETENRSVFAPATPQPLGSVLPDSADTTQDEDGLIELSPLSPNVCIERGPSRYHSAHSTRRIRSPTKTSTLTSFFTPPRYSGDPINENVVADRNLLRNAKTVRT